MVRTCRVVLILVALLYAAALALYVIGTFGWFGSPQGPLAGVFLLPLGLPWNLWLDSLPESLRAPVAIASPAINLLLVWLICRWTTRR